MSIDTGQAIVYQSGFPLAGVTQGTQPFRDNFTVIKTAIENIHRSSASSASLFAFSTAILDNGKIEVTVSYSQKGLVLPTSATSPVLGSIRFNNGIQYYTGTEWATVGGVASFNGRGGPVTLQPSDITTALGFSPAASVSPGFTGSPTAPTAAAGTNDTKIATTAFVTRAITNALVSAALSGVPTAPTADPTTASTQIATTAFVGTAISALLVSPIFTGTPRAPTAALATNNTQIATTAFVKSALAAGATTDSPAFSGIPTAPTPIAGTNTNQLATTAFVRTEIASLVNGANPLLDTIKELADAINNDANFATNIMSSVASKVSKTGDTMTGALTIRRLTGAGLVLAKDTDLDRNWLRWNQGNQWWQAGFRTTPYSWVLETATAASPADDSGWTQMLEVARAGTLKVGGKLAWTEANFDPDDKSDIDHVHDLATPSQAGFMSAIDKAKLDTIETGGGFVAINTSNGQIIASGNDPQVTFTGEQGVSTRVSGGEVKIGFTPSDAVHGNLGGGALHATATTTVAGFMSATDKTKLDSLVATVATTAALGYMSAADKTKLDALKTTNATTSASGYMSAIDKTKLDGLVSTVATTSAAGYMSAIDKTKMDSLVATTATTSAIGYMSATDKTKIDTLVTTLATPTAFGYMSAADKLKLDDLVETGGQQDAITAIKVGATTAQATGAETLTLTSSGGVTLNLAANPANLAIGFTFNDTIHGNRAGGTAHALAIAGGANGFMSGADKSKLDSVAANAQVNQNAISTIAVEIDGVKTNLDADTAQSTITFIQGSGIAFTPNAASDAVTIQAVSSDTLHGYRSGGALHASAVANGAAGFMSGADKAKLDALTPTNYVAKTGDIMTGALQMSLASGGGIEIKGGTRAYSAALAVGQDINGVATILNRENALLSLGTNGALAMHISTNGSVGIGTNAPEQKLHVVGDSYVTGTMYGTASSAHWADVAERYESDAVYVPGTVVVYGGEAEITLSRDHADTRVAGVISTQPAYMLNADAGTDETHPYLALVGRVPCLVHGAIRKGDLLTTSEFEGRACRASEPKLGTIIGKALEDHAGGFGMIEIAIQRS